MGVFIVIVIIIAILIVKKISNQNKENGNEKAAEYYQSATEHERNGNYDQAIADCSKAISSTENYIEYRIKIWSDAKGAAARLGKYGEVSDYPPNTDSEKRNIAKFLSLRGEMYDKKGDKNQAMADYDEAIKNYNNLGTEDDLLSSADVYIKKGRKEGATEIYNKLIWEYNKSIQKHPNDFSKLYFLGQLRVKAGDYDQAIANFESLLKINQDNVKSYDDVKVLKDTQDKAREEIDAIKKIVASK